MTPTLTGTRRLLVLGAGVGLLTGCAGPKAPFDIGTQAAPVALVLGQHAAVVAAPVGPISAPLPPSLAPFIPQPPAGTPDLPTPSLTPPALGPCPAFDPLAPVSGVGLAVAGPPAAGSYPYRAQTTDSVGKTTAKFTGNSTWQVSVGKPDATTAAYPVTLDVTIGSTKTRRVFQVLPKAITSSESADSPLDSPDGLDVNVQVIDLYNSTAGPAGLPTIPRAAPNLGRYGPAGIYLQSQSANGVTFTPTVPIPIVQTPVGNNSFTALGTDGVTNMTFVSTVKKKSLVNACGTKLEAVQVELTSGLIGSLSPDGKAQQVSFTETLDFGLQFGGLPLSDKGEVNGTALPGGGVAPDPIKRTFEFTINTTPKRPA